MKTIELYHREQLERDILLALLYHFKSFESAFLLEAGDFFTQDHKKIFNAINEIKMLGQEVNLVSVTNIVPEDVTLGKFVQCELEIIGTHDFIESCKRLREDTIRDFLNRKADHCQNSREFFDIVERVKNAAIVNPILSFEKEFEKYEEEYERILQLKENGENPGILTDWKYFNKSIVMTHGNFVVLGARTSIGKTAFALNMAIQAAYHRQKVLFISMEMGRQAIFDRIFANLTRRNSWDYRFGNVDIRLPKREMIAIKDFFFFTYAPMATTDLVDNLASKDDYDLVIVDYLQLLRDKGEKNENESLRLGRIAANLQGIAGKNNCVLLAPAQLNRDSEKQKREPTLADLRDSGAIEQAADIVLLLHREDRQKTDSKIIIAKNRHGALGEVDFSYMPDFNVFRDRPPVDL